MIFTFVVSVWCILVWAVLGGALIDFVKSKRASKEESQTEIGISPVTHAEMHADLKRISGDLQITSEYIPVASSTWRNQAAFSHGLLITLLLLLGVFGHRIGESVFSTLKYQAHVSRMCERTGPITRGYHSGVWSDHPDLKHLVGKEVPKAVRIKNAKKLCGHD